MFLEKILNVIRDTLAGINVDNLLVSLAPAIWLDLPAAGRLNHIAGAGFTPAGEATSMPMVDKNMRGRGTPLWGKQPVCRWSIKICGGEVHPCGGNSQYADGR
jgi:hypothetical protein